MTRREARYSAGGLPGRAPRPSCGRCPPGARPASAPGRIPPGTAPGPPYGRRPPWSPPCPPNRPQAAAASSSPRTGTRPAARARPPTPGRGRSRSAAQRGRLAARRRQISENLRDRRPDSPRPGGHLRADRSYRGELFRADDRLRNGGASPVESDGSLAAGSESHRGRERTQWRRRNVPSAPGSRSRRRNLRRGGARRLRRRRLGWSRH